jgi:hypothetical protein
MEDERSGPCSTHGEMRNATKFWSGNPKRRDHSEDLDIDVMMILE